MSARMKPICERCGFDLNVEGVCDECGFDAYAEYLDDYEGDDAQEDGCIYCGNVLALPEIRFNSDGTKDYACYGCAYENGWIDDDLDDDFDNDNWDEERDE